MRVDARLHFVARALEAVPERVGVVLRRDADGLPLPAQVAQLTRDFRQIGAVLIAQRFHPLAELFLDAGVGPAAPLVGLARFAQLGSQRSSERLQLPARGGEVADLDVGGGAFFAAALAELAHE